MKKRFSPAFKILILLLLLFSLTGCGTGGLENAPAPAPAPSPSPAPAPSPVPVTGTTISGFVVDGFIVGASVRAYRVNPNGTRGDAIAAAVTTDGTGRYNMNLGNYTGPVLIESSGGTQKDWATGNNMQVTDTLSAVMSNASGSVTIHLTPLTHMASLRARQDMALNKAAIGTAIDEANAKISEYFGGINILQDAPIDPTLANSTTGVSQNRIDYALILAGISQSAQANSLNPLALALALARDAEDGVFDGKQGATQLTVTNANGVGTTNLSATAAKADLRTNINTFQTSAANTSGGSITTSILTSLGNPLNTGVIRSRPDMPAGLTVSAVSTTQINLSWAASIGVSGYKIYKEGTGLRSVTATNTSDTGLTPNTPYCYAISAFDAAGNESARTGQLCVTTNNVPPPVPTGLTAAAVTPGPGGVINLAWNASSGATRYNIYRAGSAAALASSAVTNYSDTGLAASTRYCYAVSALDATGSESAVSAQVCANTALTVPTGLTVTAVSATQINLSWAAVAGVSGYKIYKNGTLLGTTPTTAAVETGLTANTLYCYAISAFDAVNNESARSIQLCVTTPAPPAPARIDLLVSNPQLNSDGAAPVTLLALVRDSSNRAMKDQEVSFTANSGILVVTSAKTDANGIATATINTGGDPENRAIALTAAAGNISATNQVNVVGTNVSISGLQSLTIGDSVDLTIFLRNSAGGGIAGKTITVNSALGNTLSSASYNSNLSGQITVRLTATVAGLDTVTATAIGATKTYNINVSPLVLTINPPAAGQKVNIDTWQNLTATYTSSGAPVVGATVNFTTTRGTLSATSALTNGGGQATVQVRSANSGPAEVTASVAAGPAAQVAIEFIATNVASVLLQASPATIGTNSAGATTEKSLITAVVRDPKFNLVADKQVTFTIVSDVSGGRLSPGSALTDSSGAASAYFIAGSAPTALEGVVIRAAVEGKTAETKLTVAGKALHITLAAGPDIIKLEPNKYQKNFVALVTDAAGNPVKNMLIYPTLVPIHYKKGYYRWVDPLWVRVETLVAASSTLPAVPACANEDGITNNPLYDFNGNLNPGEDQNGNNQLDPGGVASVTATLTDATGHSIVSVVYSRDYANWVNVKLEVWAQTVGSTASAVAVFDLPGAGDDYANQAVSPPGNPSPFGSSPTCYVDLTVTPLSSSDLALAWRKSPTAASYNIYRDGLLLKNVAGNSTTDSGLASSRRYCYEIKAVDAGGGETSLTRSSVCAATLATTVPSPPQAPTGLTAVPAAGPVVTLAWNAAPGAALYNIYRNGTLHISSVPVTVTDNSVSAKTGYCYQVTALSISGEESPKSSMVCTATP